MMEVSGSTILLIILGFGLLLMITIGVIVWTAWNRRKYIYCRFLNQSGKWEVQAFKTLDKTFYYKGAVYEFDIRYCTRDKINRPISSYYSGYPKQIMFEYGMADKQIKVGTVEINSSDFREIMLTKIIKDIFSDDNLQMWFIIMLVCIILAGAVNVFVTSGHNPQCTLQMDNSTLQTIKEGVRQAIAQPVKR